MADCVRIKQSLQALCCDGDLVTGQVSVALKGPSNYVCQLFDPVEETWITPGKIGTYMIGEEIPNAWITCPLPCLNQLNGPDGDSAFDIGFYYELIVNIDGEKSCTYNVGLDCNLLNITVDNAVFDAGQFDETLFDVVASGGEDVAIANLEDVIILSPIEPVPNPNEIFVSNYETTTTLVGNGDGTYTYTNEDGTETTFVVGSGGSSDPDVITTMVNNFDGTYTYTNEVGDQSIIDVGDGSMATLTNVGRTFTFTDETGATKTFDGGPEITTTLVNNTTTRTFVYTNEVGVTASVNYSDVTTTMVDNGDGTFTYTNELGAATTFDGSSCSPFEEVLCDSANGGSPVYVTGVIHPVTGVFRAGPNYTNPNGTPYTGPLANLVSCDGGGGSGGFGSCGDLAGCSINSLLDVNSTTPTNGQALIWDSGAGAYVNTNPSALGETITSLVANGNGTMTYTNEVGLTTTFKTVDKEKIVFSSGSLVTYPSSSALDIDNSTREFYAYAVTCSVAPTGNETFTLTDFSSSSLIASGTLLAGSNTTGIVNFTPYTLNAGSLLQANILTANGSEKFTLYAFYRTTSSELGV